MRFGFSHHPAEHYSQHVELVRFAERAGFDFAWMPDQTFFRDPYVMLAACGAATETIQLGLAVTNPFTRHPAMTARAAATAAEFAPGRFQLGFGAGNRRELLGPLGLDVGDTPGQTREAVAIVRALLAGERVEHRGRHFQAEGVALDFAVERPPPIYVAGRGPAMLRAAGEVADGVIVGGLSTPRWVDYAWREITAGAARSGRDLAGLEIVAWLTCAVTDDRAAAIESMKPMVAHIVGGAPERMLVDVGVAPETIAAIKREYAAGGKERAAPLVTEECIDTFALVGDGAACLRRIRALEAAGVTQFGMLLPPGTVAEHRPRLARFAEQIIAPYRRAAA